MWLKLIIWFKPFCTVSNVPVNCNPGPGKYGVGNMACSSFPMALQCRVNEVILCVCQIYSRGIPVLLPWFVWVLIKFFKEFGEIWTDVAPLWKWKLLSPITSNVEIHMASLKVILLTKKYIAYVESYWLSQINIFFMK